jgi:hypothetical protein
MFGQGSLGAYCLGQPEEFPSGTPIPAEAIVWFTVATLADVEIEGSDVIASFEQ